MTSYTDRLEAALDHGLSPAQARQLAGSGRGMAEALAEWREEGPDADAEAELEILNEMRARRTKGP